MSAEIVYDGIVESSICFFVTTTDECDGTYLGTEGPFWDKNEMLSFVDEESKRDGVDQVVIHCANPCGLVAEKKNEKFQRQIIWQHEGRLVLDRFESGLARGSMCLQYPLSNGEVTVLLSIRNRNDIQQKLKDVPVRITIERVVDGE